MNILKNLNNGKLPKNQPGQSLVEMAIITPILILMFLGVFEIGWALRGYLVLTNVNREATRYGVKVGTLNFSCIPPKAWDAATSTCKTVITPTDRILGYADILAHTTAALGGPDPADLQLPLEFLDPISNVTMILSYFVIDTGFPCAQYNAQGNLVFDSNCNCTNGPWFADDDLIEQPGDPRYAHHAWTYGISRTTRIGGGNYNVEAARLITENNRLLCNILKANPNSERSANQVLYTEMFYNQPQLLGVPFISNRVTDPIPLYGHTAMRIVSTRDVLSADTVSPYCELYPITFHDGIFADPNNPIANQPIDAFEGGGPGNFGWLTWNPAPANNNTPYVAKELANPRLSMHDYTNTADADDHGVSIGDKISSSPGVGNGNDVKDLLHGLVGRTIRVPIYHTSSGSGQNVTYTVSHFALITVNEICLPSDSCAGVGGNDKLIRATFVRYDDDACR